MLILALVAKYVSELIVVSGKNPVEDVLIAIIFGIIIRNTINIPSVFMPGIQKFEKILALGIVLLGAGLSLSQLVSSAYEAVGVVSVCILVAPLIIYFLGRWAGLPQNLAILIGVGTTICGGTAIAIAAPIIEAEDSEVSYSIATIALFGLIAIFVYPFLAQFMGLSDKFFGLWAGTAIHSTPQVLAAGFSFSDEAGQIATITKLFRNLFIIPTVVILGFWIAKQKHEKNSKKINKKTDLFKAVPGFLYGFVIFVIVRTLGDHIQFLPEPVWTNLIIYSKATAKFLILVAMAGIGLRSDLFAMRKIGFRPFYVGLAGSIILAGISFILVRVAVS